MEHAGVLSLRQGRWNACAPGKGARFNANTATEMGNDPDGQLYDLATDPGERFNIAGSQPDRVAAIEALFKAIRARGTFGADRGPDRGAISSGRAGPVSARGSATPAHGSSSEASTDCDPVQRRDSAARETSQLPGRRGRRGPRPASTGSRHAASSPPRARPAARQPQHQGLDGGVGVARHPRRGPGRPGDEALGPVRVLGAGLVRLGPDACGRCVRTTAVSTLFLF